MRDESNGASSRRLLRDGGWIALALALFTMPLCAAELDNARKLYLSGEYDNAIRSAQQGMSKEPRNDDWPCLLSQSLRAVGRYAEALKLISDVLDSHPFSVQLRMQAYEVFRQNGQVERARQMISEAIEIFRTREWALTEPKSRVAVGRALLIVGADPKLVLENFFNPAKTGDPNYRESYLAIGQLALDKYDDALAADTFREALKRFPDDPDVHYGLAKSFAASDRPKMGEAVEAALEKNKRHIPSLLLQVDHLIDAEEHQDADAVLKEVLAINPAHPEAWAYRAVLAHVRHQADEEKNARARGLEFWKTNPQVDHLIGLKLSQKYRFVEGSAYQRRALASDTNFIPARLQLSQDLLRLGQEEEGWALAQAVHEKDAYDVVAYNLTTLHDTISKYRHVTNASFALRMTEHEGSVYAPRTLELLQRARDTLAKKYDFTPPAPTLVEIFPEQKDFAIRTFAMPGGEGFLAVCFGNVITVNSPASQRGVNWEAVLWHEFCHTITLGITKNKMPRWLSEGISVFEETQANPAWGQPMTPKYRELILDGKLTPVGNLSAAFMTAKSSLDMQFAYFQSAMVVEYLVQKYGLESLKKTLRDLAEGLEINEAIAKNNAPLADVEKEFEKFARERAEKLGKGLDWTRPPPGALGAAATIELHPKNYYRLTVEANRLLNDRKWEEAKAPLLTLLENYPEAIGADSPYPMLAVAHRGLKETDKEWEILSKFAVLDATAVDAYSRLMELATEKKDWNTVITNANRYLAVNPLVALPYQYLGRAAEETARGKDAVESYRTLLKLDPPDPVDVNFRLAKLLKSAGDASAKRHVLQALEDAPRYREALRLLAELNKQTATNKPTPPVKALE